MYKHHHLGRTIIVSLILLAVFGISFTFGAGEKEAEEVTIKYWAAPLGTEQMVAETWDEVNDQFYKETGIKVEYEMVPWNQLWTKLLTAMTGGGGPDVTGTGNNMSIGLSSSGGMLTLDSKRLSKVGGKERFQDRPFMVTGEQGKDPVTLPLTVVSNILFYNTEMFAEVGADEIPKEWDKFIELCQEITKDTDGDGRIDRWGYGLIGKPIQCWKPFLVNMFQRGVEFLDSDGNLIYNSDAGVEALLFESSLISKYKITPPVAAEWNYDDTLTAFYTGQVAATLANSDSIALLNNTDIKGKFMVSPLPYIWPGRDSVWPGGSPASSHVGGTNVGILKNTEKEEAALAFLEFVTRPEINKYICDAFQSVSPVKGAYAEGEMNEMQEVSLKVSVDHTTPMPLVPHFQPSLNIAAEAVQEALVLAGEGKDTYENVKPLLDAAVEEANTSLIDR